jgi:hypothetical protein
VTSPRSQSRTVGQALVEFALVVPVFLLCVLAIFEVGRAVYYVQILGNAAREGARYAIVHGDRSACPSGPVPSGGVACDPTGALVAAQARAYAIAVIDSGSFVVTPRWCQTDTCPGAYGDGDNRRGMQVRVEFSYTYRSLLGAYLPIGDLTVQGESRAVVNH